MCVCDVCDVRDVDVCDACGVYDVSPGLAMARPRTAFVCLSVVRVVRAACL